MAEAQGARFFLLHEMGPTSFTIKGNDSPKKFKVMVGHRQMCNCPSYATRPSELCVHIFFVMLKVLRVPDDSPLLWQRSLIDSEVEQIIRRQFAQKRGSAASVSTSAPLNGRGKGSQKRQVRKEVDESCVCPICQEGMRDDEKLTFCSVSCGNNIHLQCMLEWGQHRVSIHEPVTCPFCRESWGSGALSQLQRDVEKGAGRKKRRIHCGSCKQTIRSFRHRCVSCRDFDLCRHCFQKGKHKQHRFVSAKDVTGVKGTHFWEPAFRGEEGNSNEIKAQIMRTIAHRELTSSDYDMLLQLDRGCSQPLYLFLLSTLSERVADLPCVRDECSTISASYRILPCGHSMHSECVSSLVMADSTCVCPSENCDEPVFKGLLEMSSLSSAKKKRRAPRGGSSKSRSEEGEQSHGQLEMFPMERSRSVHGAVSTVSTSRVRRLASSLRRQSSLIESEGLLVSHGISVVGQTVTSSASSPHLSSEEKTQTPPSSSASSSSSHSTRFPSLSTSRTRYRARPVARQSDRMSSFRGVEGNTISEEGSDGPSDPSPFSPFIPISSTPALKSPARRSRSFTRSSGLARGLARHARRPSAASSFPSSSPSSASSEPLDLSFSSNSMFS